MQDNFTVFRIIFICHIFPQMILFSLFLKNKPLIPDTRVAFLPDHLLWLDEIAPFINVTLQYQVAVGVVSRQEVGDNSAGDAESSGN